MLCVVQGSQQLHLCCCFVAETLSRGLRHWAWLIWQLGPCPTSVLFSDCSLCRESKTPRFSTSSHLPDLLSFWLRWLLSCSPLILSLSWIMPRVLLIQYPIISSHHKGMPMEEGLHTRSLSYQLFPELETISVYSVTPNGLLFCALVPWIRTNSIIHSRFCNGPCASASATAVGQKTPCPIPKRSTPGWESSRFQPLKERPKIPSPWLCVVAVVVPQLWHTAQHLAPAPGCSPGRWGQAWGTPASYLRSLSHLCARPLGRSLRTPRQTAAILPVVPPRTGPGGGLPCSSGCAGTSCARRWAATGAQAPTGWAS